MVTEKNTAERDFALAQANPYASSSLVPMLVSGLVLIVIGMVVAFAMS